MVSSTSDGRDIDHHQKSYICSHAFTSERHILYVTRPDGDWCFMCGDVDHPADASALRVVGLGHVLGHDPSLAEVLDLEPNEEAERATLTGEWTRSRF